MEAGGGTSRRPLDRPEVGIQDQERCSRHHHHAQSVAHGEGYVQQQGVDFDEVFAPVARLESVQLLLAYTAGQGWLIRYMDVKSAFLNGKLQEEVFITQPPGFIIAV
jgi:hypothetical protein